VLPSIAHVVASNVVRFVQHGGLDAPGLLHALPRSSVGTSPLAPATDSKRGILMTSPSMPATDRRHDALSDSKRGILVASKTSSLTKLRDSVAVAPAPGGTLPPPPAPTAPLPNLLLRRVSAEIGWANTRQERAKRDFVARFARLAGYSYSELEQRSRAV